MAADYVVLLERNMNMRYTLNTEFTTFKTFYASFRQWWSVHYFIGKHNPLFQFSDFRQQEIVFFVIQWEWLLCSWHHGGHAGGHRTKVFPSPLGTKLFFRENSTQTVLMFCKCMSLTKRTSFSCSPGSHLYHWTSFFLVNLAKLIALMTRLTDKWKT